MMQRQGFVPIVAAAQLRLVGGMRANTRLLSSRGEQTRPMMEKVNGLLFIGAIHLCFALHEHSCPALEVHARTVALLSSCLV